MPTVGPAKRKLSPIAITFLFFGLIYLLISFLQVEKGPKSIAYSQFLSDLDSGKVSEVFLSPKRIEGEFKQAQQDKSKPRSFVSVRVEDPTLPQKLKASGVKFSGIEETGFWTSFLSGMLPFILLFFFWSWIFKRKGGALSPDRGGGLLSLGRSKAKIYVETDLKVRFDDVAGVDEAKIELKEIVSFLKEPKRFSILGGRMPKGILLVGPPGTGKTLLARAVAGEAKVPFFSINGSEFVEMFVGLGAARVRDLFQEARRSAPCIIFIDELDALGKARGVNAISGGSNDEKEQTLNQLLAELDGFDPSIGIVLLAATNRPEVLDPALLRAGRFDRSLLIDRPDRKGRELILKVHLKKIKVAPGVDVDALASMTAGFSGADLANLANEAALIATRRDANEVVLADFTEAIERIVAGLEKKSRLLTPLEKKRVAYHEMGHVTVALALGHADVIHKVSIIPRGMSALGYTISRPTEDRYLMERKELETKMAIALGGRASEAKFFPDISTGASDDLIRATEIARAMVTRYGMSTELGIGVFERDPAPMLGGQMPVKSHPYSEKTSQEIDREVKQLLDGAMDMAKESIERYETMIEEAAQKLLVVESLDEQAIKQLWAKYVKRGDSNRPASSLSA